MANGLIGQVVGSYRLTEEIGHGSFSMVYIGQHKEIATWYCATKILDPRLSESGSVNNLYEKEKAVLMGIDHPYIVALKDIGSVEIPDIGNFYFVQMKYMEQGNLSTLLKNGSLPQNKVVAIAERMLSAMEYLDSKGILHCDIHEKNVLFDKKGEAYLADFGLARWAEQASLTTRSGSTIIARYAAPEQINGDSIDGRTDIFQLGATLQFALTGFAYAGFVPTKYTSDMNEGLVQIISKSMEIEPNDRWQSASAMREALLTLWKGTPPKMGRATKSPKENTSLPKASNPYDVYLREFESLPSLEGLLTPDRINDLYAKMEAAETHLGVRDPLVQKLHSFFDRKRKADEAIIGSEFLSSNVVDLSSQSSIRASKKKILTYGSIAHAYSHHDDDDCELSRIIKQLKDELGE